jgi:hypothetical protein
LNKEEPEQAIGEELVDNPILPGADETLDLLQEEQTSFAQEEIIVAVAADTGDEEEQVPLGTTNDVATEMTEEKKQDPDVDDLKTTDADLQISSNGENTDDALYPSNQESYFTAINGEEKKDDAFDILDALLDDSYMVEEGHELLDPFSEPRQSFDNSDRLGTPNSNIVDKKSVILADDGVPEEDFLPNQECDSEVPTRGISCIPIMSPIPTVDSLVSSMGSSIDEGSIGSGRLSRQTSSSSLSSFWDIDTEIPVAENAYSEALMCSEEQYLPNLHSTKGPCERCLSLASKEERAMFRTNGRHVRIMLVRGGCKRSCTAFPRSEDEAPVRLCRKCYFDTHRKPRSPMNERCHYP